MNLPDVNEMYPQVEPVIHSECTFCGTEIFAGEQVVNHNDCLYCDIICMATDLLAHGEAKRVIAGE